MVENPSEAKDFESLADDELSKVEIGTPDAPSGDKQPEDQLQDPLSTTAEVDKTEKVKEVEANRSLSVEQKIAQIKEILGDDEKAIEAYIKQKGYHNDPAWQKQREQIDKLKKEGAAKSSLSVEDKAALEELKQFRSSPEYIKLSMQAQGYTKEAIDKKLIEAGHGVEAKPEDDVTLVINKLGIKLDDMNPDDATSVKSNISDVARIFNVLFEDKMGKTLPKQLAPFKENIENIAKAENANKLERTMKETVKAEGVLDFEKDVEPEINKFLDDNPDATQQDVFEHFKKVSHSLSLERLKTGKKKEERDDKKSNLRQNIPFSGSKPNLGKKTGNFEKDADAFLESLNA